MPCLCKTTASCRGGASTTSMGTTGKSSRSVLRADCGQYQRRDRCAGIILVEGEARLV